MFLLNREGEAASEWEAILAEEPGYAPSLLNLGQLHAKAGRHELAMNYFRAGMAVPRDSAFSGSFEGPYRAAWLLKQAASAKAIGNASEAIDALSRAVALVPSDPAARFQLGNALLGVKRFEEAVVQLEAADALVQGKPAHLAALGYGLFKLGRLDEAERRLSAAVAGAPRYALAWFHLGNVKVGLGDRAGARGCFVRALEIRPDFSAAREGLEGVR
jgi:tetratricopeptide (TPR) repeat protein